MTNSNKKIGVGTIFIMLSQFVFLLSNYIIQIGLGRFFGPETYGTFGVVMSFFMIIGTVLNAGFPMAVSKSIASSLKNTAITIKESKILQLKLATLIGIGLIVLSKVLANLLGDLTLTKYIILIGLITIPYGLYNLQTNGILNGLQRFRLQSLTVITHHITRVIATFIFVYFGLEVMGALFGYFIAILIGFIFPLFFKGENLNGFGKNPEIKIKILKLAKPLILTALGLTLIRNLNTLFVKALVESKVIVGYYQAAVTLSNIPYLIFVALPITLLPTISKTITENNLELTKKYIQKSTRYLLILLLPIIALISATSTDLVTLLYSSKYSLAGSALSLLVIGGMNLAFFRTFASILIANNQQYKVMITILTGIPILAILNFILIPKLGIIGAATSFIIATFFATFTLGFMVYNKFGPLMSLTSFVKILASALALYFVTINWHFSGIYLMISYVILSLGYFGLLFLIKELQKEDISFFVKMLVTT